MEKIEIYFLPDDVRLPSFVSLGRLSFEVDRATSARLNSVLEFCSSAEKSKKKVFKLKLNKCTWWDEENQRTDYDNLL